MAATTLPNPDECVECHPELHPAPGPERLGPEHVGVRFGDAGRYRVLLNGDEVTDACVEADASAGWVLVQTGVTHYGDEPHMEVRRLDGVVTAPPPA